MKCQHRCILASGLPTRPENIRCREAMIPAGNDQTDTMLMLARIASG